MLHSKKVFPNRALYNPLRSLGMSRVVTLQEQSEYGYYADLQWLYHFIERREPVVRAIRRRRQAALGSLDWVIDLKEQGKTPEFESLANEQQAALREEFGRIKNLREAWKWLGMAFFRGFAHLEVAYDKFWRPVELIPVPQWFWCRAYPRKAWLYNADATNVLHGEEVNTEGKYREFIVREVEDPMDMVASIEFIRKNTSIKDWDAFANMFGVPNVVAFVTRDLHTPSQEEVNKVNAALEQWSSNGRLSLPAGWDAKLMNGGSSDGTPFPGRVDYIDKMLVITGTGGKLTMLSEATGIGSGATSAHEQVFNELAQDEANEIANILQEALAVQALDALFPGQPHLVEFKIRSSSSGETPGDNADLMWKLKLGGWRVKQDAAESMVGVPLEKIEDPALLQAQADTGMGGAGFDLFSAANRANRNATDDEKRAEGATALVEAALRADMQAVVQEVIDALADDDRARRDVKLKALEEKLPAILAEINADPESASVFEEVLAQGIADGLTS